MTLGSSGSRAACSSAGPRPDTGPRLRWILLAVGLLVLASGCATRELRPQGQALAERDAWFADQDRWQVDGRVGLSDGRRAGSMGFVWKYRDNGHFIHLRTTAGGKQWQLRFNADGAVLEGGEVGRLEGPHPDALVEEAVGWPIPVAAMAWWIRGLIPPQGMQELEYGNDGELLRVHQAPWALNYKHFRPYQDLMLPARLDATAENYQVRIAVGEWRFGVEVR